MFEIEPAPGLKKKKIEIGVKEELQLQEVLLDSLSQREEFFSRKKLETPLKKRTLFIFALGVLGLLFLLLVKDFQLQILRNKEFSGLAENNYLRLSSKRANRGVIYDSSYEQLVFNELSFDLICRPSELPSNEREKEAILSAVIGVFELDRELFEEKLSGNETVLVKENMEHKDMVLAESRIQEWPGFFLEENIKRKYIDGSYFFHVLGYLGRVGKQELEKLEGYSLTDYLGKTGLEKEYEEILKGRKGRTLVEKNIKGYALAEKVLSEPEAGESLVLWLEADLQRKIFEVMENTLKNTGAQSGAVIALDPRTGGVLALVSFPSFDNNLFFAQLGAEKWQSLRDDPLNPFWNRAIAGIYSTGSTIKPLIALAALEEKIINPDRAINCEGKISVPNPWHPDNPWIFGDWKTHGWIDMRKAIAESCNVYFYTIGGGYRGIIGLEDERIKKYLTLFGWGSLTGIDLPGEKAGLIPDRNWKKEYFSEADQQIWLPGDTYNLSIGQGYLSITPLQVASSFAVLANQGQLLKPLLVKEIINEKGEVVEKFEPFVIRQDFVDSHNLKIVREGMREAVIYGSSRVLSTLPVTSASKTGTAQTSRPNHYHNWVTVFAPYDEPEIVLTVVMENVPEEQVAALPVANEVLYWYFTR